MSIRLLRRAAVHIPLIVLLSAALPLLLPPSLSSPLGIFVNAAYGEELPGKVTIPSTYGSANYFDSSGNYNIVGVVRNSDSVPVQAALELAVTDRSGRPTTIQADTYGSIIYPSTESPFKFTVPSGYAVQGAPQVAEVAQVPRNYYNVLVLNYTNMAVGDERALVGTITNTAPFEMHNVSVYASVHNGNMTQIDSVRTETIPVLKPGETKEFSVAPDPSIRSSVLYYSCAGVDYDDPVTAIRTGDGHVIAYDITATAKIDSFRYADETDSIMFGIQPYSPQGGPVVMKIAQLSGNQTITVMMDGQIHDNVNTKMDGSTITIDFFVPEGQHQVSIQGVRNVPEFPSVIAGLAVMVSAIILISRYGQMSGKTKSSI